MLTKHGVRIPRFTGDTLKRFAVSRSGLVLIAVVCTCVLLALLPGASHGFLSSSPPATADKGLSCGPHLLTYRVGPRQAGMPGRGLVCARMTRVETAHRAIPVVVWYAQGWWFNSASQYRNIGVGLPWPGSPNLIGYAADQLTPGMTTTNSFPGVISLVSWSGNWRSPRLVDVVGDWDDRWTRARHVTLPPLRHPTGCGSALTTYRVTLRGQLGAGTNCVLRVDGKIMAWIGYGHTTGRRYTELGFLGPAGYGARDLCAPAFGSRCETFSSGDIKFKHFSRHSVKKGTKQGTVDEIVVTRRGAGSEWMETWQRSGT
jgi:hypothetical protein